MRRLDNILRHDQHSTPVKRKKLTMAQQRFAIEVFEECLNGAEAHVRGRGKQVKVEFVKKLEAASV